MKKKIKICFVQADTLAVFNPKSKAKIGGAEVDLYNIATELVKDARFEIFFLIADFDQKELEIYNNIKVVKGHSQSKSIKSIIFSFIKFYRRLAEIDADIYITANHSKYVGLTNFYCKIFHKVHIHRTEHQHQVDKKYNVKEALKLNFRYIFFLLGFLHVNHIIVQNEEDKHKLQQSYGFPSTVIKNSFPIKKRNVSGKDFILWVARAEKWKRPELFINLAKEFPNEKFVMIMPAADNRHYFELIRSKTREIKNLKFIPGVPFSEVEEYYKKAKIFINTSLSEGFPNSFNQAMNSSTPILSLNINPDNFIQKNQVGIYCHNQFDELIDGINTLLNNKDIWNKFSQNAYNFVYNEMNIENAIKIWKVIFFHFYNQKHLN